MQKLQFKRGPSGNITSVNLDSGEPAYTTDTRKLYIGNSDGTKTLVNPDAPPLKVEDIPNLPISKITGVGTAAGKNTGTASGEIPLLGTGGKLPSSVLPPLAITDVFTVGSQAAMLALSDADPGDIAIRTDVGKTFILKASPYSTLANWHELLTPTAPVQSVAGRTGAVTLAKADVGLGNVTNESKTTMFTNAALTGTPTAPTAGANTNNTQIATTAFVKSQGFLTGDSVIDGGTF